MGKIIKERVCRAGYILRCEIVEGLGGDDVEWTMAYTPDGHYIGRPKIARMLCVDRGIKPQLRTKTSNVCSIGFSSKNGKWYGWSHRAIFSFGVGDKLFDEKYGDDKTPFNKHGDTTIKTMSQAHISSARFADSVR